MAYDSINARFQTDATMGINDALHSFFLGGLDLPRMSEGLDPNCTYDNDEPESGGGGDDTSSTSSSIAFRPIPRHIQTVRSIEARLSKSLSLSIQLHT